MSGNDLRLFWRDTVSAVSPRTAMKCLRDLHGHASPQRVCRSPWGTQDPEASLVYYGPSRLNFKVLQIVFRFPHLLNHLSALIVLQY